MAWVTEDKDVKEIVRRVRKGAINRRQAVVEIGALNRFLDWEIEEAIAVLG